MVQADREEISLNGLVACVDPEDDGTFTEKVQMPVFTDEDREIKFVIPGLWWRVRQAPPIEEAIRTAQAIGIAKALIEQVEALALSFAKFPYSPSRNEVRLSNVRPGTMRLAGEDGPDGSGFAILEISPFVHLEH